MKLELPDFRDLRCIELDLCGFVADEEAKDIKAPKLVKKALKSEYPAEGQSAYFGIVLPFPNSKKLHIHLRVALAEYFSADLPVVNSTPEQIMELIDPFKGKRLEVKIGGVFSVQQHELPPFIRSTIAESQSDGIQVRMVGGTLAVTGAPIHRIAWKLGKGSKAQVDLEAKTKLVLTQKYLVEALDIIDSAFKAFIFGEQTDE